MRWACLRACRSEPQMPQARVLTRTCPAAGFGSGQLSATIWPLRKMAARIADYSSRFCPQVCHSRTGKESRKVRSGVGRGLTDRLKQLRTPHPLAMGGVKTARHDEAGADDGPAVGDLPEHEEAEQADPEQL